MTDKDRHKADVETVLTEFDKKKDLLANCCKTTKNLIEKCLAISNIRFQSVQERVKGREKLREKYLDPRKNYAQLNDITDQAALRVITYYEDEVDRVAEIIKQEFDVDHKNSVDKRETDPEKFGYYALNLVCCYSAGRTSHVEYKEFGSLRFEIQITSVLRHAWSEIEHPWYDLKDAFPPDIKRRFARMAALLEIAESEFLTLRKVQADYTQSVDIQVQAAVPDISIDSVSLRSFIEQDLLVSQIDESLARIVETSLEPSSGVAIERWTSVTRLAGITKLQELHNLLDRFKTGIPEYLSRCRTEVWPHMRGTSSLYRGVSIYHLAVMLVCSRDLPSAMKLHEEYGWKDISWDVARQVAISRAIVAKYGALGKKY